MLLFFWKMWMRYGSFFCTGEVWMNPGIEDDLPLTQESKAMMTGL